MSKNNLITVKLFDVELGRLGFDPDKSISFFQYNSQYLQSGMYSRAIPFVIKRTETTQVFKAYGNETFRGLPPPIADSLPDMFGNKIFNEWLAATNRNLSAITPLEQLAYVANRGMGALEYEPAKKLPKNSAIDIQGIINVLEQVLNDKSQASGPALNSSELLNIFKIGTSAGGARPKILVSENKATGEIIPGDLAVTDEYAHYLVKLYLPEEGYGYNKEKVEFAYYQLAIRAGINMMSSKLIDDKHFATLRFDRQHGEKLHTLTATGLTGWDFKSPEYSSYEHLFELAAGLRVPHKDIQELFRRMVFNIVFANTDDHLKNHSFIYNKDENSWYLAPAYDITYPLNINLKYTHLNRALSINNKRLNIGIADILKIADQFTIKNPNGIIEKVTATVSDWEQVGNDIGLPGKVISGIGSAFVML